MRRTTIHSKAELEAIDAAMSALPSAMKRLESELTPRMKRFGASCDGILNQSFEMSDVMAAHGIQGAQKERRHHAEVDHVDAMLREQASKIVRKLAKRVERNKRIEEENKVRDVRETAKAAMETLNTLAEAETQGSIKDLYAPFDVNRTGRITHADFSTGLTKASANVNKIEVENLLSKLDPYHTGTVLYGDVADKLKAVSSQVEKSPESRTASLELTKSETPAQIMTSHPPPPPPPSSEYANEAPSASSSGLTTETNSLSLSEDLTKIPTRVKPKESNTKRRSSSVDTPRSCDRAHCFNAFTSKGVRSTFQYGFDQELPTTPPRIMSLVESTSSPSALENSAEIIKHDNAVTSSSSLGPKSIMDTIVDVETTITSPKSSMDSAAKNITKTDTVSEEMIRKGTLENNVCTQIGGRVNVLRHALKKGDISGSGVVNKEEFKRALKNSGVVAKSEDIDEFFEVHSQQLSSEGSVDMGLSNGKGVNIDGFLDTMRSRITSSAFAHLAPETRPEKVRNIEEMRAMKKVLRATGTQENSCDVFNRLDPEQNGFVTASKLKDGLNQLGSNLTDSEFKVILKKVDKNKNDRISIKDVDKILHQEVSFEENKTLHDKLNQLNMIRDRGFSNSFKSHEVFYHNGLPTYDSMTESKDHRTEDYKWSKIQNVFQSNKEEVLQAFGAVKQSNPSTIIHKQNEKLVHLHQPQLVMPDDAPKILPVGEILRKFEEKTAISFGEDDKKRISREIKNSILRKAPLKDNAKDANISLANFCEMTGIYVHNDAKGHIVAHTKNEPRIEEGVFQSSRHSLLSRPNFATTYALESANYAPGFRKKKFLREMSHNPMEPSKFWEMSKSSDSIWPTQGNAEASLERRGRATLAQVATRRRSSSVPTSTESLINKWGSTPLAAFAAGKKNYTKNDPSSTFSRLNLSAESSPPPKQNTLRRGSPFSRSRGPSFSPITGLPMSNTPVAIQGGGGND